MSRAEAPNTVSSHPDIRASIQLFQQTSTFEEVHLTGQDLEGVFEIETTNPDQLSLARIEIECICREDVTTKHDALGRVIWQQRIAFQGPGLPTSNAVLPQQPENLPKGYYSVRRGITSFPIRIPLPVSLPGSIKTPVGAVAYTLHGYIEIGKASSKQILHVSQDIQVVSDPSTFNLDSLKKQVGNGELIVPSGMGGGKVSLTITDAGLGGWAVEGRPFWLEVDIRNASSLQCHLSDLRLVRIVTVTFGGGRRPAVFENVASANNSGGDTVLTAERYCDVHHVIDLALPGSSRTYPGNSTTFMSVTYQVVLTVQVGENKNLTVTAAMPLEIFHPASLPSEVSLSHEALVNEMRAKTQTIDQARSRATRRWSTPPEVFAGYFSPPRHLPAPIPNRIHIPAPPVLASPFVPAQYAQPAWVIYDLPPVPEEATERTAERTSRHLRETSGQRGRSVSPPSCPHFSASTSSTAIIGGPRPAPVRTFSLSQQHDQPILNLPQPKTPSPKTPHLTPPLLSPIPQQIEPNSYFDQAVHQLSSGTTLDVGKLSSAAVISLQDLAENLDNASKGDVPTPPLSNEDSFPLLRVGPQSPSRERRSVLDVFAMQRPDAKRRESNERKVEVETRRYREASFAAEVFRELEMNVSQNASDEPGLHTKTEASAITQSHISNGSGTSQASSPPQLRSLNGSIRGQDGQVTAAKQLFSPAVTGSMILSSEAVNKAKRHSLAFVPVIAQSQARRPSPASTTRPPVSRMISEDKEVSGAIKKFTAPPPLEWEGSRSAKKTFEEVDVKDKNGVRKRGAVGRLRALVERFERW